MYDNFEYFFLTDCLNIFTQVFAQSCYILLNNSPGKLYKYCDNCFFLRGGGGGLFSFLVPTSEGQIIPFSCTKDK